MTFSYEIKKDEVFKHRLNYYIISIHISHIILTDLHQKFIIIKFCLINIINIANIAGKIRSIVLNNCQ